jgi:hypothetical protein
MIVEGQFLKLGSVVDLEQVPSHHRKKYTESLDQWKAGKVMLLKGMTYSQRIDDPNEPGVVVTMPRELVAGTLVRLSELPRSQREALREGEDYVKDFTEEQQEELLRRSQDEVLIDTNVESMTAEELADYGRNRNGY